MNELKELTTQLNAFKPVSTQTMREEQKMLSEKFQQQFSQQNKVYEEVQQKLGAQTVRIDQLSDSVKQSQQTAQDTTEGWVIMQSECGGQPWKSHFRVPLCHQQPRDLI